MSTSIRVGRDEQDRVCMTPEVELLPLADNVNGKTRFVTATLLALAISVLALMSPTPALAYF